MKIETKICNVCEEEKIIHEFTRKYYRSNECQNTCKDCVKKKKKLTDLDKLRKRDAGVKGYFVEEHLT